MTDIICECGHSIEEHFDIWDFKEDCAMEIGRCMKCDCHRMRDEVCDYSRNHQLAQMTEERDALRIELEGERESHRSWKEAAGRWQLKYEAESKRLEVVKDTLEWYANWHNYYNHADEYAVIKAQEALQKLGE